MNEKEMLASLVYEKLKAKLQGHPCPMCNLPIDFNKKFMQKELARLNNIIMDPVSTDHGINFDSINVLGSFCESCGFISMFSSKVLLGLIDFNNPSIFPETIVLTAPNTEEH